jgi:hypothetical protein
MSHRLIVPVLLGICILGITPAQAGSLVFTDGHAAWQSTACPQPSPPPALAGLDPESRADDLNLRIGLYNMYARQMQAYMDCVSEEAQQDSNAASETITASAQALIGQAETTLHQVSATASRKPD